MGMSIPLVQLSSLDQIRGFVAVGRRMSITLAAQDLCLTQSAVSRQIQALEEKLGVKLLTRNYRSIAFTAEGERLYRSADGAVQQLQDVMGEIRTTGALRPVSLSATIGVVGLWLLPRLNRFQKLHPNVDIRISANNLVGDLRHDDIDLSIRYTTAALAPKGAIKLFEEVVAPVAHPSFGIKFNKSLDQLLTLPLLEFDNPEHPYIQWASWLNTEEYETSKKRSPIRFNQYDQVIQAALAGQGVALGRLTLIQPYIDEGRLVVVGPAMDPKKISKAYWLLQAEERPRKEVNKVAAWIAAEAKA